MSISSVSSYDSYLLSYLQKYSSNASDRFSKLDANTDGKLNISEFESIASKIADKTGNTSSIESMFAEADADSDGALTLEEFSAFKPEPPMMKPGGFDRSMIQGEKAEDSGLFNSFDINQDGALDSDELEAFAGSLSEMSGKSITAEKLMEFLDSDGDSSVSLEEFEAGKPEKPPKMNGGGGPQGAGQTEDDEDDDTSTYYDVLDTNQDGVIDAEELAAYAAKLSEKSGKNVSAEQLMKLLDSDSDNEISFEEFASVKQSGRGNMNRAQFLRQPANESNAVNSFNILNEQTSESSSSNYSQNYFFRYAMNAYNSNYASAAYAV